MISSLQRRHGFAAPVECAWSEGGRGGSFCSKDPLKWPWLCHLIPQQPARVTMRGCRDSGEKLWYRFKLKRKEASFWFECKNQIPDSTCVGSACHQMSSVLVYTGCFCSCSMDWNEEFIKVCQLNSCWNPTFSFSCVNALSPSPSGSDRFTATPRSPHQSSLQTSQRRQRVAPPLCPGVLLNPPDPSLVEALQE